MPIGIVADKLNRNHLIAAIGCILICVAFGLTGIPLIATIIVGLGNGMFHIGGGVDILNISEKKGAALGIFVSPGAFGVYFGTVLGRNGDFLSILIIVLLLVAAFSIFAMKRIRKETFVPNVEFSPIVPTRFFIAVICLFLVVCLRSYVGLAIEFPWKSIGYWSIILVCASAFGKVIGGFLLDKFGAVKITLLSLGFASLLFLLPQIPIAGVSGVLLFNMTMPITLWFLARMMPGAKGFSFGLLTFALFLGFLPGHLGVSAPPFWLFSSLSVISLVLLMFSIRRYDNGK